MTSQAHAEQASKTKTRNDELCTNALYQQIIYVVCVCYLQSAFVKDYNFTWWSLTIHHSDEAAFPDALYQRMYRLHRLFCVLVLVHPLVAVVVAAVGEAAEAVVVGILHIDAAVVHFHNLHEELGYTINSYATAVEVRRKVEAVGAVDCHVVGNCHEEVGEPKSRLRCETAEGIPFAGEVEAHYCWELLELQMSVRYHVFRPCTVHQQNTIQIRMLPIVRTKMYSWFYIEWHRIRSGILWLVSLLAIGRT
jgi:hypothetical protein